MIEKNTNHHDLIKFVKESAEWPEVVDLIIKAASSRSHEELFTAANATPITQGSLMKKSPQEFDRSPYGYDQPGIHEAKNWRDESGWPTSTSSPKANAYQHS